jgi:hypothetical protein
MAGRNAKQPVVRRPRVPVRKAPKKVKRRRIRLATRQTTLPPLARLIADPCNAKLLYGPATGSSESGYLLRVSNRVVLHGTAANVNGYMAWFPDYHTSGSFGGNLFTWESTSTTVGPINTTTNPYGTGSSLTAFARTDPAHPWSSSAVCSQSRTLAACVKVFCTSPVSTVSGSLAVLNGCSVTQLLGSSASGGGGFPLQIVDIFSNAPTVTRIPLDALEVRHAPSSMASIWRSVDNDYSATTDPTDFCVQIGTPVTGPASVPSLASANQAGIVIAWSGLNSANASDLVFEFTKVIEWMPDATNGPQLTNTAPRPSTTWEGLVGGLDTKFPGWKMGLVNSILGQGSVTSKVAAMALGGSGLWAA